MRFDRRRWSHTGCDRRQGWLRAAGIGHRRQAGYGLAAADGAVLPTDTDIDAQVLIWAGSARGGRAKGPKPLLQLRNCAPSGAMEPDMA